MFPPLIKQIRNRASIELHLERGERRDFSLRRVTAARRKRQFLEKMKERSASVFNIFIAIISAIYLMQMSTHVDSSPYSFRRSPSKLICGNPRQMETEKAQT